VRDGRRASSQEAVLDGRRFPKGKVGRVVRSDLHNAFLFYLSSCVCVELVCVAQGGVPAQQGFHQRASIPSFFVSVLGTIWLVGREERVI